MDVRVEGQVVDVPAGAEVAAALQKALSGKKFKTVVAARALADGRDDADASGVPRRCPTTVPNLRLSMPIPPKACG